MTAQIRFDILTLFPAMIGGFLTESMIGRAIERGLIDAKAHNLRDWAEGKWQITDDRPFGGGAGMLLKPEPLFSAIDAVKSEEAKVIYLSADGERLTTALARELAQEKHLVLVSGHYEGIDERVREAKIDREISIGDYVLTNGTLPAAVLIDTVARQIPGVLGEEKSLTQDSFSSSLLGFPQYTRPVEYNGMHVPEVLLSGNHAAIAAWRRERQEEKTRQRRPDLLSKDPLS
jgi:tRNA (guanine37-N1)-methyltransferase|tara:strand:+ start:93 stop:788 length:696 start_codon:yes stop_codon:yes gene_type:complete